MTMEVRSLLSHVMLETSGCKAKNSTLRRPNPVVIPMPPSQKSEELLQPVDTSSQASTEAAEASIEGIPPTSPPLLWPLGLKVSLPSRCNGALGKCQQSPQGSADHQSIHRCP